MPFLRWAGRPRRSISAAFVFYEANDMIDVEPEFAKELIIEEKLTGLSFYRTTGVHAAVLSRHGRWLCLALRHRQS